MGYEDHESSKPLGSYHNTQRVWWCSKRFTLGQGEMPEGTLMQGDLAHNT